jgi:hypothetical protein
LGAPSALLDETASPAGVVVDGTYDTEAAAPRALLGEQMLAAVQEAGSGMSLEETITCASAPA